MGHQKCLFEDVLYNFNLCFGLTAEELLLWSPKTIKNYILRQKAKEIEKLLMKNSEELLGNYADFTQTLNPEEADFSEERDLAFYQIFGNSRLENLKISRFWYTKSIVFKKLEGSTQLCNIMEKESVDKYFKDYVVSHFPLSPKL